MGIRLYKNVDLKEPFFIVGWPGIGNVGLIAVDTLRKMLNAEFFGEVEGYEFFNPRKVKIKDGLLLNLEFPSNKLYYSKRGESDFLFFVGEEQPKRGVTSKYAEGEEAYNMANLVIDIAERFKCKHIFTSGAAVSYIHHTMLSKVWAVPNDDSLLPEVKKYPDVVLMSEIEGRGGQGFISGLNGLLIGVAKKRGFKATCFMGEVPIYLQGLQVPYPKASRAVLRVFNSMFNLDLDLTNFDNIVLEAEGKINEVYEEIPLEIREQLEKLKEFDYIKRSELQPLTDENRKRFWDEISEFLKKGGSKSDESL
jgi:proteasome assembly chaperone (PAC2) family protein